MSEVVEKVGARVQAFARAEIDAYSYGDSASDMLLFFEAQSDMIARAAIQTTLDEVARHLSAVQYDAAPYTAMKHRLATMRKEALGDE